MRLAIWRFWTWHRHDPRAQSPRTPLIGALAPEVEVTDTRGNSRICGNGRNGGGCRICPTSRDRRICRRDWCGTSSRCRDRHISRRDWCGTCPRRRPRICRRIGVELAQRSSLPIWPAPPLNAAAAAGFGHRHRPDQDETGGDAIATARLMRILLIVRLLVTRFTFSLFARPILALPP